MRLGAAALPGYPDDRRVFTSWAETLARGGPLAIYGPTVVPTVDYTPGYLYVLWAAGLAAKALGGGPIAWRVLLTIVPIAGDLAVIALLYALARRFTSERSALVLVALAAFAPPMWLDSAVFSQSDSVPLALALVALMSASSVRFALAWAVLAAAIVVKPLVVILGPTIAVLGLRAGSLRSAAFWRTAAVACTAVFAIAYFATLPFTTRRAPEAVMAFLLGRYTSGTGKAPYTTEGAFSIYPLFTSFHTSDATTFGPFSFALWGVLAVLAVTVASAVTLARALRPGDREAARLLKIFGAATLPLLALFLFATRMHERYLLPALVFGSPLTLDDRPSAIAISWLAISFTINCIYTLHHFVGGATHPVTIVAGRFCCALNVAAFAILCQRQVKRLAAT